MSWQPGRQALGRIDKRGTFEALRKSRTRGFSGPVRITFVSEGDFDRPYLAFAINRKVGGAVMRNLLRRRLRSIATELSGEFLPGAYLVGLGPKAASSSYGELRRNLSSANAAIVRQASK